VRPARRVSRRRATPSPIERARTANQVATWIIPRILEASIDPARGGGLGRVRRRPHGTGAPPLYRCTGAPTVPARGARPLPRGHTATASVVDGSFPPPRALWHTR